MIMRIKVKSIPVHTMTESFGTGIAIGKASVEDISAFDKAAYSHRDDYHIFFLQEKGITTGEIDFQQFKIENAAVVYVHPNQVHRLIAFENVTLSFWAISNEDLNPEYLKLLEEITPAKPLLLEKETFSVISEAVSLCIKISERNHERLYHSLLKDTCNTLVALVASQYLAQAKSAETLSRSGVITKGFKSILESNFITAKKPADYAQTLHISSSYLNECVKNTTGYPVSYHIQQRVILEAKRLLYYSDKTVKEIAFELGYDDYPYFSRLFTKVTTMTPLTFRNKNLS
jgi:AraC family transcriptional activator of pobA